MDSSRHTKRYLAKLTDTLSFSLIHTTIPQSTLGGGASLLVGLIHYQLVYSMSLRSVESEKLTLISASSSSAVFGLGRAVRPPPAPPAPRPPRPPRAGAPARPPRAAAAGGAETREASDWSCDGSRAISTFMGRSVRGKAKRGRANGERRGECVRRLGDGGVAMQEYVPARSGWARVEVEHVTVRKMVCVVWRVDV